MEASNTGFQTYQNFESAHFLRERTGGMIADPGPKRESIASLRALLGDEALLIKLPLGAKVPDRSLTSNNGAGLKEVSINDDHRSEGINVAVVVGPKSGGIFTVDCDTDEVAELFRAANSLLCDATLVTKAARGCNYWFRSEGDCPPLRHLTFNGAPVGEIRSSDGSKISWTVVQGHHHSGCAYEIINREPVATASLDDLMWIDGTSLADAVKKPGLPAALGEINDKLSSGSGDVPLEALEAIEASDVKRGVQRGSTEGSPRSVIPQSDIDKAVSDFIPGSPHQTNKVQFRFARRIKRLAQEHNAKPDLFDIGGQWYDAAKSNLRPEHELDKEGYIMEFVHRYGCVDKGEGEALADAWKQAQTLPVHPEVQSAPPNLQTLQRLCLILATMKGDGTFTLGGAQVIDLIGDGGSVSDNAKRHRGRRYLGSLETYGVIKLVKRGHQGICSTYQYLLDDLKLEVHS